ncbi:NAD(+)--rifampin ADP-ribosyltransferase [Hyphomonas sp.]|uniref:NAD(+)--rifampin ADP-ribosyltransferase n=1 Tax=Hyphomonas sp. TaxID=87 RepID=UPI00391D164F
MSSNRATPFKQTWFHGTRAVLSVGKHLAAYFPSNYSDRSETPFVYFTATLDAAIWGAELAAGDDAQRIYLVEPTGEFENDPNLTDQKFPGNPSQSFRSREPLRIIGEVVKWVGHPGEQVAAMKASLAALEAAGIKPIQD